MVYSCYAIQIEFITHLKFINTNILCGQSVRDWSEGSRFEPRCRQNIENVLVVGKGSKTPSEHRRGALEQGVEPTNAHIGPYDELATHPGDLPCLNPYVHPPHEGDKDETRLRV